MLFGFQKKSRDDIQEYQLKRIQHIVKVAFERSEFYRGFYQTSGFHPDMLKSYDDIQKIPIVKRAMLKSAPVETVMTRRDTGRLNCHTTTGSTGIPVKFYFDAKEELQKNLGFIRAYGMMGIKPTYRTVALRDPVDIRDKALFERLGLFQYDYQNIYDGMENIYRRLCSDYKEMDVLKGMPSDLVNLSYIIRHSSNDFPNVKIIVSDSEVLDEYSRAYIEETFSRPVLDTYACVEAGCIAFQMPGSNKYYLNEDQVLLESIGGERIASDAVITNLRNTTLPIIRYQIGDVVEFGDGESDLEGVNLRTIERVHGKYLDFIVLPDKSIVSPHVPKQELTHGLLGIKKFQIVQTSLEEVEVIIEPDEGYTEETEREIKERLSRAFKNQVLCTVKLDEHLSEKSSRKFKCVDSVVAQNYLSENAI